ncbi:pyruvate dehydrogenase (acetyl-transferring) kinase, mitochondrial [Tanacetum coccineum]
MTRSSTKELFTPFNDPKQEFQTSRKHFKTLSLDESRSLDFDLFSDQEEYSEEEVAKTMAETMEQYMSKTRADYGLGIARPKIEDKDNLKTKFLSKYCPLARAAKKMEEINNFQQEPEENLYQAWERFNELLMKFPQHYLTEMQEIRSTKTSDGLAAIQAQLNNLGREIKKVNEKVYVAQVGYEQCKGPHCTKYCPLKEEGKTLEEAYYTQFGAPFQGGGYRATALGFYQRNNINPSYQERRQSKEETLSKFMSESAKKHKENSNLIKEIRASTDVGIRNQGVSIKTLEFQIGQMSKISTIVEADSYPIRRMGSSQYAVSTGQNPYSEASHINNSIPRKEKDLGSFTLPCFINNVCFYNALADLGASVSVMPLSTYLNLRLGELAHTKLTVELADRTVKYPKGIAENVLVCIGKFVFPVDFIILDMPEDIKVPMILKRPILSTTCAKIDVFKRKITLRVREEKIIFKSVKPASSLIKRVYMLCLRERMELDLEARLMGETLVLNRSLDPFFEDYIELNGLNVPLELRRDQVDDLMLTIEEGEVTEEFRARNDASMVSKVFGYPILEDMDAYRDEGMGDIIFGEPFLREVGINAKRFEGMITIHNGNEEVTYQMARSHPRFKNHTNEKCNRIPPLLKKEKKSTMLVENLRSGNLEVLES